MGTFQLACPQCGAVIEADESLVGRKGKCEQCGSKFTVPEPEAQTFEFACPHCRATMDAEEGWLGQVAQCPSCGKDLTVQRPAVSLARPVPSDGRQVPVALEPPVTSAGCGTQQRWFVVNAPPRNGLFGKAKLTRSGPFTYDVLSAMVIVGELEPDHMVAKEASGPENWEAASTIPNLFNNVNLKMRGVTALERARDPGASRQGWWHDFEGDVRAGSRWSAPAGVVIGLIMGRGRHTSGDVSADMVGLAFNAAVTAGACSIVGGLAYALVRVFRR